MQDSESGTELVPSLLSSQWFDWNVGIYPLFDLGFQGGPDLSLQDGWRHFIEYPGGLVYEALLLNSQPTPGDLELEVACPSVDFLGDGPVELSRPLTFDYF